MDPHSIFEKLANPQLPPTDSTKRDWPGTHSPSAIQGREEVRFPGEDGGKSLAEIAQRNVDAALQLLAEQAQYITGATGAAIALRDHEEMFCRASAGPSAPEVGSQLQVNSGLSGESVRTRETLRCDDAATDPRVNRESCEALGIASVVVMPLVRANEVIGVFELFSDKAHVFEARDISALERMGNMVFTALEHAGSNGVAGGEHPSGAGDSGLAGEKAASVEHAAPEEKKEAIPALGPAGSADGANHEESVLEVPETVSGSVVPENASTASESVCATEVPALTTRSPIQEEDILGDVAQAERPIAVDQNRPDQDERGDPGTTSCDHSATSILPAEPSPVASEAPSPESSERTTAKTNGATSGAPVESGSLIANLKRCEVCGFPISESRRVCIDCEKKQAPPDRATQPDTVGSATGSSTFQAPSRPQKTSETSKPGEELQLFRPESDEGSWLSSHKYMIMAMAIAIVAIVIMLIAR
jgi:putative methionine-R-sulfoxide reductase with GAF domain